MQQMSQEMYANAGGATGGQAGPDMSGAGAWAVLKAVPKAMAKMMATRGPDADFEGGEVTDLY